MAIKGLTDRNEVRFPRIGFIRKGGPKRERSKNGQTYEIMGLDLDHFRFDSDDTDAMDAFQLAYGDEPKQINIFLPWPEVEDNFQAWKEEYTAGGLKHRCDGETCVLWQDAKDGTYHTEPKPCPGGCKEFGYLSVIIPELKRLAFVTVLTHSKHDIMELQSNLEAYRAMVGQLRGIPLILRRVEREVSMFDEKAGKRVRRRKWLMHIETAPRWTKVMLSDAEYSAIPGHVRAALPAPIEAQYVIEGFATELRMEEIDGMSVDETRDLLAQNNAKTRGIGPDWQGFGDEPEVKPTAVPKGARIVYDGPHAHLEDDPGFDQLTAATDAAFDALPSASAERAGNGKAPANGAKHDPARAWDDERKEEAVAWAMRRYPEIFEAKPHARKSLDKLIRELGQDGTVNTPPDTIARAWKEKCAAKQDELDAKKLQAVLDAQAAGDEKPGF